MPENNAIAAGQQRLQHVCGLLIRIEGAQINGLTRKTVGVDAYHCVRLDKLQQRPKQRSIV